MQYQNKCIKLSDTFNQQALISNSYMVAICKARSLLFLLVAHSSNLTASW